MYRGYWINVPALTAKGLALEKKPAAGRCDSQTSLGECVEDF